MSLQNLSSSDPNLKQRACFVMQQEPRLLKVCLLEDSNSCSSNGFISFPRHPLNLCPIKPKKESKVIHRNTLKTVINAVKNLRLNTIISAPSILPRSLSRRLSKKKGGNKASQADVTVRVKDIVRWRSSRVLHEDESLPPDSEPSTVTTTTTTSGTPCSSWCDSDFTSEFLPSWGGSEKEVGKENCEIGKKDLQCVGEDSSKEATAGRVADTEVGPEDLLCDGDTDHNSPLSVLEIEYEDDGEASDFSFCQCLENVERTKQKLMQTIKRFENLAKISPFNLDEWASIDEDSCNGLAEENVNSNDENYNILDGETEDEEAGEVEVKARQLWSHVKEGRAIWIHEEHLIMDFFRDEVLKRLNLGYETNKDQDFVNQLVGQAKEWIAGERLTEIEHGSVNQRRKACVREIQRGDWNVKQMKEESKEVAVEIWDGLFNLLMDETLTELYQC